MFSSATQQHPRRSQRLHVQSAGAAAAHPTSTAGAQLAMHARVMARLLARTGRLKNDLKRATAARAAGLLREYELDQQLADAKADTASATAALDACVMLLLLLRARAHARRASRWCCCLCSRRASQRVPSPPHLPLRARRHRLQAEAQE